MLDEVITRRDARPEGASRVAAFPGMTAVPDAKLTKYLTVRRSQRVPELHWWSLPLRLRDAAMLHAGEIPACSAIVHPASALGGKLDSLGAVHGPGGTARVSEVRALLEARDTSRIGACAIAMVRDTIGDEALEPHLAHFRRDLEQLDFIMAILPEGDDPRRHRFCFRVPGKIVQALEHLAHGRTFDGDPARFEQQFLHGLALGPRRTARLQLILQHGGVQLIVDDWRRDWRQRLRETRRRLPLGEVMPLGLPVFIAGFWIVNLLTRRGAQAVALPVARGETPGPARSLIPQHVHPGSAACVESES